MMTRQSCVSDISLAKLAEAGRNNELGLCIASYPGCLWGRGEPGYEARLMYS